MFTRLGLLLALGLGLGMGASAQSIALTGILGDKALLVIDGSPPKLLAVGQSRDAIKLVGVDKDKQEAVLEVLGKRSTLRMGTPVSVGATGGRQQGSIITIPVGTNGHFFTPGYINGRSVNFMVDTGASAIAMGMGDADRIGIRYRETGTPVQMGTANGVAQGWRVTLAQVRIGEVTVSGIDAVIGPHMPYVLLGNNYLSRFSMKRSADTMVLERQF